MKALTSGINKRKICFSTKLENFIETLTNNHSFQSKVGILCGVEFTLGIFFGLNSCVFILYLIGKKVKSEMFFHI